MLYSRANRVGMCVQDLAAGLGVVKVGVGEWGLVPHA